ncbi:MAG: transglycosylase domain-containing protein [Imperialibacter sp.]|uniref:penicillin-binding protein 1A n=1 Tax=Imperialibacter sp. TaxID=2038411 RepID=UPI0032EAEC2B
MKSNKIKWLLITLWVVFICTMVGVPVFFNMIGNNSFGLFGELPGLQSLENPEEETASQLFSADNVLLGKYFRENRTPVTYDELSRELTETLLVTEDLRFSKHSGIDLRALVRAVVGKLTFSFAGGGSTITMQLAENLYKTEQENKGKLHNVPGLGQIITKFKEWIIAVQLEKNYTKEEILAMYLNTVPFGSNAFGIKAAAKTFFNKEPKQITYHEAALLVGLVNAPTRYSPILNPETSMRKRNEVLYNLRKYNRIDQIAYDSLRVKDFDLQYKVDGHNEGLATYFRTVIRNFLMDWTTQHGYDLFEDGLKIYTTIDSRMQAYAEESMREHMDTLQSVFIKHLEGRSPWINEDGTEMENFIETTMQRTSYYKSLVKEYGKNADSVDILLNLKRPMRVFSWNGEIDTLMSAYDSLKYYKHFLQAGFMAMDPHSGHIKAWVGGIDHKYFQFDHVMQGKRQPGSTIKPFVYSAVIDNGYSPCYEVADAPITFSFPGQDPPTWTPSNAVGNPTGNMMTIRSALAQSVNTITAYWMKKLGPQTVVDYAHRIGIQSELAAVPALCLGAGGEVSVYEMVGAYSTFVNQGVWTEPIFITRIEDENGRVLQDFVPQTREALSEETAYTMLYMLRGATEEPHGSGGGLSREIKANNQVGAKTGTTQNASDGWFMGVTKDLVAGGWVGGDDRSIHFRNWAMGQGARTAMPIWNKFMLKVYADPDLGIEKGVFPKPVNGLSVELDCSKHDRTQEADSLGLDIEKVSEDDIF